MTAFTEKTTLHFDFSHLPEGTELKLVDSTGTVFLQPHTPETRALHRTRNRLLAALPHECLERISHFVPEAEFSDTEISICLITYPSKLPGAVAGAIAGVYVHRPRKAVKEAVKQLMRNTNSIPLPGRMKYLNPRQLLKHDAHLSSAQLLQLAVDYHTDASEVISTVDMALKLVMEHPEINTVLPDAHYRLEELIFDNPLFSHLVAYLENSPPDSEDSWYENTVSKTPEGKILEPADDLIDKNGKTIEWPTLEVEGKTYRVYPQYNLKDELGSVLSPVVLGVLETVKNTPWLKGQNWTVQNGVTTHAREGEETLPAANELLKAATGNWSIQANTSQYGMNIYYETLRMVPGTKDVEVEVKNWANRYLGVYCQFFDADGNQIIHPNWTAEPPFETAVYAPNPGKKYLTLISPGSAILGGPVQELTPRTRLVFSMPDNAATVKILLGGLGDGSVDMDVDKLGIVMTSLVSYGIPVVLTALSTGAKSQKWYIDFFKDNENIKVLAGAALTVYTGLFTTLGNAMGYGPLLAKTADFVGGILFSAMMKKLALLIAKVSAEDQLMQNAPVVGWALRVTSLAAASASMIATSVAVSASPSTFEYEIKRTMTLGVSVSPDPTHGTSTQKPIWPETGTKYRIMVKYEGGTITLSKEAPLPIKRDQPINVLFSDYTNDAVKVAPDKKFQVIAVIYTKNDSIVGQWTSDWYPLTPEENRPGEIQNLRRVKGAIIEMLVPLLPDTKYEYNKKLAYSPDVKKYWWNANKNDKPKATQEGLKNQDVSELLGLTLNNMAYKLGYAYYASRQNLPLDGGKERVSTRMYVLKSISTLQEPGAGMKVSDRGMSLQPGIAYDQFGPEGLLALEPATKYMSDLNKHILSAALLAEFQAKNLALENSAGIRVIKEDALWSIVPRGASEPMYLLRRQVDVIRVFLWPTPEISPNNFYLDTSTYISQGKHHLRLVNLRDNSSPYFNDTPQSWGSFHTGVDDLAIHPAGYAVTINYARNQLYILRLPTEGKADKDAPAALSFGGFGEREGLLGGPVALTVTADGRILVLESRYARVQAFDTYGNPVACFATPFTFTLEGKYASEIQAQLFSDDLKNQLQLHIPALNTEKPDCRQRYLNMPLINLYEDERSDLDQKSINDSIRQAFDAMGIGLGQQVDVSVTKAGNYWMLKDKISGVCFDLRYNADSEKVEVYRSLSFSVTEKTRNSQWVLDDQNHGLRFSAVKEEDGKIRFTRLASTMSLKNKVTDEVIYHNIACETKGYLYVLWHKKPGTSPSDYRLDIYYPDGKPLTEGGNNGQPNAARMVVDQWRNLFTLNYEQMEGPEGRPEPSISQWIPNT